MNPVNILKRIWTKSPSKTRPTSNADPLIEQAAKVEEGREAEDEESEYDQEEGEEHDDGNGERDSELQDQPQTEAAKAGELFGQFYENLKPKQLGQLPSKAPATEGLGLPMIEAPEDAEEDQLSAEARGITKAAPLAPTSPKYQENADLPKYSPSKELIRPTRAPGNLSERTRGDARSRADTYMPDSDPEPEEEHSPEEEITYGRPAKRQRLKNKAKQPLVQPRRIGGNGKVSILQSQMAFESNPPAESAAQDQENTARGGRGRPRKFAEPLTKPSQETLPQKKRGRPRKVSKPEPDTIESEPLAELQAEQPLQQTAEADATSREHQSPPQAAEGDGSARDEGVSDILMSMSPVKPIFLARTNDSGSVPEGGASALQAPSISKPTPDSVNDEHDPESDGEVSKPSKRFPARSQQSLFLSKPSLIDVPALAEIRKAVYLVGFRQVKNVLKQIKEAKLRTAAGKTISDKIERLRACYRLLQMAKEERNKASTRKYQHKITDLSKLIHVEARKFLSHGSAAGDNSEDEDIERLLKDLYFCVVPKLMRCVECCAEAHVVEGSMETPALQEFSDLVELLERIAYFMTRQPNEVQPKSGKDSYKTSKPTRQLYPKIRDLRKKLSQELRKREKAERLADQNRLWLERERELEEENRQKQIERDNKRMEIRRAQSKAFQEQLNDPDVGRLIARPLLQAAPDGQIPIQLSLYAKRMLSQHSRKPSVPVEDGEEDDPFAENNTEVRVSVFGKNNKAKNSQVRKLTTEERKRFMAVMRRERGD